MLTENPGIFIVEDHPLMREGLASYFKGTGRWQIAGIAASLEEAKRQLTQIKMDIVLLDIQLEDGWGLDLIPFIKQLVKQSKPPLIAVYSAYDDYSHVRTALGLGARVYLCKRRSEKDLEKALLDALGGKICIDGSVQEKLDTAATLFNLLTKRESEILNLVKDGLSNREIAVHLGISHRTVENILSCIYDKTGIKSRLELERL